MVISKDEESTCLKKNISDICDYLRDLLCVFCGSIDGKTCGDNTIFWYKSIGEVYFDDNWTSQYISI